jgi:hypothetical protein
VTELAVSTFAANSTKMREGSSGCGRLPEKEERSVSVVTCKETKIADVIPQSVTYLGNEEGNESKLHRLDQFCR